MEELGKGSRSRESYERSEFRCLGPAPADPADATTFIAQLARVVGSTVLLNPYGGTALVLILGPHTLCMTHLFRPAEPQDGSLSPSWKAWRGLLAVETARVLAYLGRLAFNPAVRKTAGAVLLLLGLLVQVVLMFIAAYLTDLAVSLMEVWAELARKHLELTM